MKQNLLLILSVLFSLPVSLAYSEDRCGLWIDLYAGEPVAWEDMIEDLSSTNIIFLGEAHRVQRHHDLQAQIIRALSEQDKKVLLGIEQMEFQYSSRLEEYNAKKITFEQLAEATEWTERWKNYHDYRPILEAALESGGKIVALNARAETIRAIGRKGLASLSEPERNELPPEMNFDEPLYEQLLNKLLLIHMAFGEEMLRNVYHAQASRDETMAERMSTAWSEFGDTNQWVGVVLCGAGHCSYGLGTPSRLQRRLPEYSQRIVLMTESGDTVLSEAEIAMQRDIEISHEDLRFINRPIADYLHATEQNREATN